MQKKKSKPQAIIILLLCMIMSICAGVLLRPQKNAAFTATAETTSENSDISFTLNADRTGYAVKAVNRQVKEVIIPKTYNGLEVTEIANNGFMSCINLEKVFIPETVLRIGNNAFTGCRNLISVQGMPNVKEIGNNAFALCSKLTNLIIPGKVETLGSAVVKNVVNPVYVRSTEENITSLNAGWKTSGPEKIIYGNDLACTEIRVGNILTGYSVDAFQNLNVDLSDTPKTRIMCSYQTDDNIYYPILAISEFAFSWTAFQELSIEYDPVHVEPNYSVELKENAFAALMATSLDIRVDVNISGMNVFAGAEVSSISFPNTISEIPDFTFLACFNLESIKIGNENVNHLPANIARIGESAFESCTVLAEIYIPQQTYYVGKSAFEAWGDTQVIHVDQFDPYNWDANWLGVASNPVLQFRKSTVTLDKVDGSGGTDTITVGYGDDMPSAVAPQKEGIAFQGYFSSKGGDGKQFYDQNMNSVSKWDAKQNKLFALWDNKKPKIVFDKQGGEGGSDEIDPIEQGDDLPDNLTAPTRRGYIFKGYFAEPEGKGRRYYDAEMLPTYYMNVSTDLTLYAYWEAAVYNISYEIGDMKGLPEDYENPNPTTYTIEDLPIDIVPVESNGYRVSWSVETLENCIGDVTIEGTVSIIVYTISYNLNGGIDNGGNPDTYTVETPVILKAANHDFLDFKCWSYKGKTIENLDGITGDITLTAYWIDIQTIHITEAFEKLTLNVPNVILIFDIQFSNDCTIEVASSNVSLDIDGGGGSYNMLINILERTTNFDLYLRDVSIKGRLNSQAIYSRSDITLNLYTYSAVKIQGGTTLAFISSMPFSPSTPGHGLPAISCGSLVIHCADNLIIQGGNGTDGVDGVSQSAAKGGDGGIGVAVVTEVRIWCDNVTIAGGLPGKAGRNGKGGSGASPVAKRGSGDTIPTVYILEGMTNVHLYKSLDSDDGQGGGSSGGGEIITPPVEPPVDPPIVIVPKT